MTHGTKLDRVHPLSRRSALSALGSISVGALTMTTATASTSYSSYVSYDSQLVDVGGVLHNVRSSRYSAAGSGMGDDGTRIQAAIEAAINEGGGRVYLPPGKYRIVKPLRITGETLAGKSLCLEGAGAGATKIVVDAGYQGQGILVEGVSRTIIRHLSLTDSLDGQAHPPLQSSGVGSIGINVRGNVSDLCIEHCHIERAFGFGVVISPVYPADTSSERTIRRVSLRRVVVERADRQFGFLVDDAEQVEFNDCHAWYCWLDGFKIRKNTRNVSVIGGSACFNGQERATAAGRKAAHSNIGDALDAYSGGNTLQIIGFNASDNIGNGVLVKTDKFHNRVSAEFNSTYAPARGIQVLGVVACRNAPGSGITFIRRDDRVEDKLSPAHCSIIGCIAEENRNYGIYVNARNVVVSGSQCNRNGAAGIFVGPSSLGVQIFGGIACGNGTGRGNGYGMQISGKKVKVFGGIILGVDPDEVVSEQDYEQAQRRHRVNVLIEGGATDVEVFYPEEAYAAEPRGVAVKSAGGLAPLRVLLHLTGDQAPTSGVGQTGSPGSTYTNKNSTSIADFFWRKVSGAANDVSGWERAHVGPAILAYQDTIGFYGAVPVNQGQPLPDLTPNASLADIISAVNQINNRLRRTGYVASS